MSTTEAALALGVVLAVVAIVAFFQYHQRAKVRLHVGPAKLELDASNNPQSAIRAQNLKSRKGGLTADSQTGGSIEVGNVEVEKDIRLTTKHPPKA